ncbi:MAG TPA: hypothetical protein VGK25_13960 [Ignavibacteria bacterium]|jgi:hypothetical protein
MPEEIKFNRKTFVISILAINLLLRLYIAFQPIEFLDGVFILDDAYYSLTIARNIANDFGPSYGGRYTNGFQPLYVFLMVPVFMITQNDLFAPIRASLVICSIIDTLTLLMLLKIFSKMASSFYSLILLSVLWILNFYVVLNSLNCLETSLSVLMITISLYYYLQYKEKPFDTGNQIKLGVALGLAVFARVDNIFLVVSLLIMETIKLLKTKKDTVLFFKSTGVILTASFLAYAPWLIYSYAYTGDIFQVSGRALRLLALIEVNENPTFGNMYSKMMDTAFGYILNTNFLVILLIVFNLVIIISRGRHSKKSTSPNQLLLINVLLLFSLMLLVSYIFFIFGWWYFYRYFYSLVLTFLFIAVISFNNLGSLEFKSKILKRLQIGIVGAAIIGSFLVPGFRYIFYNTRGINTGYMNIGLWVNKSFKPGTIIGAAQSGGIGYFAPSQKIVNLDGVVNKQCYLSLKEKRNFEYIREQKIEYIVGWNSSFQLLLDRSANLQEGDLIRMGKIPEIKTNNFEWFLAKVKY